MTLGNIHEYNDQYQESQMYDDGESYEAYGYDAYGNGLDKDGATQYVDELNGRVSQVCYHFQRTLGMILTVSD
jgi:hypothetical protein